MDCHSTYLCTIYLRNIYERRDPSSSINTIKRTRKKLLYLWPRDEISAYLPIFGVVLCSSQRASQWKLWVFPSVVPASANNNSPASLSMVLKAKFVPPLLYTSLLE
jgi:hypothetical protein